MYTVFSGSILFYYTAPTLMDAMQMYTAYAVRGYAGNEKVPVPVEELVFTDSENALFVRECTNAFAMAFDVAHKLSYSIPMSALFCNRALSVYAPVDPGVIADNGMIPPVVSSKTCYGFFLLNKAGYNPNLIPMIDRYIEDYVINQILVNWWAVKRQNDFAAFYMKEGVSKLKKYNNSLFELYKPKISYSDLLVDVVVVTDDDEEDGGTTGSGSGSFSSSNVLFYDHYSDFPLIGVIDTLYIDKETNSMYTWSTETLAYVIYNPPTTQVSFTFEDTDVLIAPHGLGKYMPTVSVEDAEGNTFVVEITPIDIDTTKLEWNQPKSGIAYFS